MCSLPANPIDSQAVKSLFLIGFKGVEAMHVRYRQHADLKFAGIETRGAEQEKGVRLVSVSAASTHGAADFQEPFVACVCARSKINMKSA